MVASKNISNILKNLRLNLKLNQTQFADMIGLSQTHYSHIENGNKNPTLELVEKLIYDFNISPNEIFIKDTNIDKISIEDKVNTLEIKLNEIIHALSGTNKTLILK